MISNTNLKDEWKMKVEETNQENTGNLIYEKALTFSKGKNFVNVKLLFHFTVAKKMGL